MTRESQWKLLDNLRRKCFLKHEIKQKFLNGIIQNQSLPITYRHLALFYKSKARRSSFSVQHQNRCVRSGRIWSIRNKTQYSRFIFRNESYKGNLPGFKRASW